MELLDALDQLAPLSEDSPWGAPPPSALNLAVSHGELRLACVVVATDLDEQAAYRLALDSEGGTAALSALDVQVDSERTAQRQSLEAVVLAYGGEREWLANGALVVTFARHGSATDQVSQAARAALAIQEVWPRACVALSTGRTLLSQGVPIGEALDRCSSLLRDCAPRDTLSQNAVLLDDVSAALVDSRFELLRGARGQAFLLGWSTAPSIDESRPLLGKPTPCVGRERELSLLSAAFASSCESGTSAVVLVIAPPGVGKSRLRHEFLRRLKREDETSEILFGQGDPMSASTPYSVIRHAMRRLCGVLDGEAPRDAQAKIRNRVGAHLPAAQVRYVSEFLGELCGVPFPDSVLLHAARQDPRIMSDQVAQSFVAFLQAECAVHPVLLVLEDLQWGDSLAVKLVDVALRELPEAPLVVLALARPEVEELFPKLWRERNRQEIQLAGLSRKACERLIQHVLGPEVAPALQARLIEQAAGNAIFLEELIRAAALDTLEELPQTVLAILHARLMRLDPSARRLLRAASIFGEAFWLSGLRRLLGSDQTGQQASEWISLLVEAELIEAHRSSRFASESEYGFRHGLMREAAYSMLPEADRRKGHYLAGCYLEEIGEPNPTILATHFEQGTDLKRAVQYYISAADQAYDSNDLPAALALAERGLACHAEGEARGALLGIQVWSWLWSFQNESQAVERGQEVLRLLPVGSLRWCRTLGCAAMCATATGMRKQVLELCALLTAATPRAEDLGPYVEHAAFLTMMLGYFGERALMQAVLARLEQVGKPFLESEPSARAYAHYAMGRYTNVHEPDPYVTMMHFRAAVLAFQEVEDRRMIISSSGDLGLALARLGAFRESEEVLRAGAVVAKRLQESGMLVWGQMFLALVLTACGDERACAEGLALALSLRTSVAEQTFYGGILSAASAISYLRTGDLSSAESAARSALQALQPLGTSAPLAYVVLIRILLSQGRALEARGVAEECGLLLHTLDCTGSGEVPLLLAAADAREAVGELAAAAQARAEAQTGIRVRAARILDDEMRANFLRYINRTEGLPPLL